MSISNLQYPNQYEIYCDDMTCNTMECDTMSFDSVTGVTGTFGYLQITNPPPLNANSSYLSIDNSGNVSTNTLGITGSFVAAFGGAIASTNVTVFYTKIGPLVTLRIPEFTNLYSGASGSISAPFQIPSNLRPGGTTIFTFACVGYDNNVQIGPVCMLIVNNLGDFYIWAGWGAGNNFAGPGTVGMVSSCACTYSTV